MRTVEAAGCGKSGSRAALRALVVADDAAGTRRCREALRSAAEPFEVYAADGLAEAMRHLRAETYDAVVLGLSARSAGDLDALAALRRRGRAVPIVVVAGSMDDAMQVRAVEEGAEDCVPWAEPLGPALAGAVRRAVARRRRSGEMHDAAECARESARLQSAFLANMSHEVRTPVHIITSYLYLLRDRAAERGDEETLADIDRIECSGRRLVETIDAIVDLAKFEAGTFDVRPEPVWLCGRVKALVEDCRAQAEAKGLGLRLEADEREATVRFDDYCLSHALRHLLSNALKFTERGGIRVRLARGGDGRLRLSVTDTGIGIDPAFHGRLFRPFCQESSGYDRRYEGNGLGLSLTRRLLAANGAEIGVDSVKGVGSTFTIVFSAECEVTPAGAGEAGALDALPAPEAAVPDADRPCVVVVEDDVDAQHLLRIFLSKRYRVLMASSGDEMRAILEEEPGEVRALLMDLSLSGEEDGITLTRSLRHDERWREVPIIAVTAHARTEDRSAALSAGCTAFLSKPYRPVELVSLVEGLDAGR